MEIQMTAPSDLLCRWQDARAPSRAIVRRLLKPAKFDAPWQMIDVQAVKAPIVFSDKAGYHYVPKDPQTPHFVFSYIYTYLQATYERESGKEGGLDYSGWYSVFHDLILRYTQEFWFCLTMLGYSKGMFFLMPKPEGEPTPEFCLLVARRLLAAARYVPIMREQGRMVDNSFNYWNEPDGWLPLWGLSTLDFAWHSERVSADEGMAWKNLNGPEAWRRMDAWLNG